MKRALRSSLWLAIWLLTLRTAIANAESVEPRIFSGSVELGFIATSGNSDTNSINGRFDLTHESFNWRTEYTLSSLYNSSDSNTTAEKYAGSIQSNYKFNTEEFWFIRGTYERDRFSGYQQKSTLSTGYGNRFWQQPDGSFLEASTGLGYRYFDIEDNLSPDDKSDQGNFIRFATTFEKHLSDTSLFRQELNTERSLDGGNTVNESISTLQANIIDNLAMKFAYRIKYTSDVPDNTQTTDTETTISVLYSF